MLSLVHEEYEDKLHHNCDYKRDKLMIGDYAQVSNKCM